MLKYNSSMEVLVVCLVCYFVIIWMMLFCIGVVRQLTFETDGTFWQVLKSSRAFLVTLPDKLFEETGFIWAVELVKNLVVALLFTKPVVFAILTAAAFLLVKTLDVALRCQRTNCRHSHVTFFAQTLTVGFIFFILSILSIRITTLVQLYHLKS